MLRKFQTELIILHTDTSNGTKPGHQNPLKTGNGPAVRSPAPEIVASIQFACELRECFQYFCAAILFLGMKWQDRVFETRAQWARNHFFSTLVG
jgi:hypothetical protein